MKYLNPADVCLFIVLAALVVGACWANCGCSSNPFLAYPADDSGDGGIVEDDASDSADSAEAAVDVADAGVDAVDGGAEAGDGCAMPGLWCKWGGGDFTPCGGGTNFTCGGAACDPEHCAEGDTCRIPGGMGPDGSTYTDGTVTRCAP